MSNAPTELTKQTDPTEAMMYWHERAMDAERRIDSLERSLAQARAEAIEEAARTKPSRHAGKPPQGRWGGDYQLGWDHAVGAMEDAIRSLAPTLLPPAEDGHD